MKQNFKNVKNITEQVEDYLDDAQKGKNFSVDIGSNSNNKRVNFSQKKIIAFNKLTKDEFLGEIDDLSYQDKLKMYKMERFIDLNYDFSKDVNEDVDGGLVYMKKSIIDELGKGISKKPGVKGLKEEGINNLLEYYPNTLIKLVNQIYSMKTFSDLSEFSKNFIRDFEPGTRDIVEGVYINKDGDIAPRDELYKDKDKFKKDGYVFINAERIIGKKAILVATNKYSIKYRNNAGYNRNQSLKDYSKAMFSKTNYKEIDIEYNKYVNNFSESIKKIKGENIDITKEANFLDKETYIKFNSLNNEKNIYTFLKKDGKVESSDSEKLERKKINDLLKFGKKKYTKFSNLSKDYKREGFSTTLNEDNFQDIFSIQKTLFNDYGIDKFNFGNTISDGLAREKTMNVLESLDDLKNILNLDIQKINKLHDLSIGFAVASGLGKKSMGIAHYEPAQKFINFSKNGLNGNFAHEYFHFIDNFLFSTSKLTEEVTEKGESLRLLTSLIKYPNKFNVDGDTHNVLNIINDLYKIMHKGLDNSENVQISYFPNLKLKSRYNFSQNLYKQYKKDGLSIQEMKDKFEIEIQSKYKFEEGKERYNNSIIENQSLLCTDFISTLFRENKDEAYKYIETNGKEGINPKLINEFKLNSKAHQFSELYSNALYLDSLTGGNKEYYINEAELFARSFESYLKDKFDEKGLVNNFLVQSTYDDDFAYPQGNERREINKLFDKLILSINILVEKR